VKKKIWILLGIIPVAAAAAGYFGVNEYKNYKARQLEMTFESSADAILAGMTLEQKVGQLLHVGIHGKTLTAPTETELRERHVGGVILFAANMGSPEDLVSLTDSLQKVAGEADGIPLFISTDQEGGRVLRVDERSTRQFPGSMALGQTGNEEYAYDVGFTTGFELRKIGINFVLAPDLDVNNNPDNPVINTRSLGSKPELVARMGSALLRGMNDSLSMAVIKHFPGHGDTNTDSHKALPRITKSLEDLEKCEMVPFRRAIAEGAPAVMSAHIIFEKLDPINPATLSPTILKGFLREKLGFQGLILTDGMEMHAISRNYGYAQAAKLAFKAGAEVILLTGERGVPSVMYQSLLEGFQSGELDKAELDRAVRKQILLKIRRGLFQKYRIRSDALASLNDVLGEKEKHAAEIYAAISEKYSRRGSTLNETVSFEAIRSLRKPYVPLKMESCLSFIRSDAMKEGLGNSCPAGTPAGAITALGSGTKKIILEFSDTEVAYWNLLVAESDRRGEMSPVLLGLYTGNPFQKVTIPARGAVLASFSPTKESLKALGKIATQDRTVPQADLILAESPEKPAK